ncbi:CidA/LrgA family protein [Bisgaard Taxon 10/6]|uniref:CidA/LrgA family protein n=1 Tax=Exercitatus varius TaxID=67857 RepID=A0AAW6Q7V5_9PAST|nr:CidA/LrgA family protein [Exercitatus varius]QOF68420.1 CidA/LrgA family protein [Actinobacillus sp. GY-402]MDG2914561.1 CidA/LrgA family protein [Exercitatus varius]MDG2917984.1 CidA/LrgA family protein [Exercitatus varius]MDG2941246.1 CidA/LrgA family protein [Exercitatus varius]MDG2948023.1 CidA/LrgA family protein [Exercitatus varius]
MFEKYDLPKKAAELARSLIILYAMLFLGEWITRLIPLGIPGSIIGLLLLFLGLTTRIIKVQWIFFGAGLLIRYMAVLFVPVSVGIMKYSDLLVSQAKALVIPNVVSSLTTLIVVGLVGDYLFSLNSFKKLRKKVIKKRLKEQP